MCNHGQCYTVKQDDTQEKAQRTNLKTIFIECIIYAIISCNIKAMKLNMVTCVES